MFFKGQKSHQRGFKSHTKVQFYSTAQSSQSVAYLIFFFLDDGWGK